MDKYLTISFSKHVPIVAGVFFLLAFYTVQTEAENVARGIVIYRDHPDSPDDLAGVLEFSEVENFGRVCLITPSEGGSSIRIFSNTVVEIQYYLDLTGTTLSTDADLADLKEKPSELGELAGKHPRARELLAGEARRINSIIGRIENGEVLLGGRWQKRSAMDRSAMDLTSTTAENSLTVTVDGGRNRTYTGVKVTGKEPEGLRIMHSGGAATIPAEWLSEEDRKKFGFDDKVAATETVAATPMATEKTAAELGNPPREMKVSEKTVEVAAPISIPQSGAAVALDPDDFPGESEGMKFIISNLHRIPYGQALSLSPLLRRQGFTVDVRPSQFEEEHARDLAEAMALHRKGEMKKLWEFAKIRELKLPPVRGESPESKRLRALTYFRIRLLLKAPPSEVEGMVEKQLAIRAVGISNETGLLSHELARVLNWSGWSGSDHGKIVTESRYLAVPGNIGFALEWNFWNGDVYIFPDVNLNGHLLEHFPDVASDIIYGAANSLRDVKLDLDKLSGLGEVNEQQGMQKINGTLATSRSEIKSLFMRR